MKRSETTILLTKIAAFDQRTIGDADVEAWTEALGPDIPLADAMGAVTAHFRSSHERLMPIHILEAVGAVRRERLTHAGDPPMPGGLSYADEQAWRQLWCSAVKDGNPDPEGVANRAMKITPQLVAVPLDAAERERLILRLAESKAIPKPDRPRRKRVAFVDDTGAAS